MRRFVLCLGMLFAWPLAGQAAKPVEPASIEFGAGAWVDVDATGKAHVVEMDKLRRFKDDGKPGSIADIIKARLRERIETWEFQPATKNGFAVPSHTHVSIGLEAADDQHGGMMLGITGADTGATIADGKSSELGRIQGGFSQQTGTMVIDITYRGDGSVETAKLVSSSFDDKSVSKRALAIAMTWRVSPEIVAGQPVPGKGSIPMVFCIENHCPNASGTHQRDNLREFTAIDPAVTLKTAVAGTVL
jgi:TonB family protein